MTDKTKQTEPKPVAERPEVVAARKKVADSQLAYGNLVKASRTPAQNPADAETQTAALRDALAAKRTAVAELDAILKNRPIPKTLAEVESVKPQDEGLKTKDS